jgi:uncharacterized damage-inducible protein DinB
MSLAQSLLGELQHETATTAKLIAAIPEARFDWKPHPKSMSLGDLATHLANIPTWVARTLDLDELDLAPLAGMRATRAKDRAEALALFDANWKQGLAGLAQVTDDVLAKPWTLKSRGEVLFTLPKSACLRSFVINHSIHHRGQLTVYLRLCDVPLPQIYGPTADEPM